jgi:hypothetical protein
MKPLFMSSVPLIFSYYVLGKDPKTMIDFRSADDLSLNLCQSFISSFAKAYQSFYYPQESNLNSLVKSRSNSSQVSEGHSLSRANSISSLNFGSGFGSAASSRRNSAETVNPKTSADGLYSTGYVLYYITNATGIPIEYLCARTRM